MLKISESSRKRWVRKWEPHTHCTVCGIAMEIPTNPQTEYEFCSAECEAKYNKWQKKKKKKDKIFTYIMFGSIGVIVVVMIINFLFMGF